MTQYKTFRPTGIYWLKTWAPIGFAWIVLAVMGVRQNIGTPTLNRAISFSVFVTVIFVGLIVLNARRQIVLTAQGLLIQTFRKSFYWPWDQITAVDFYAIGSESKPRLFISTERYNYKFNIHLYAQDDLEDAITERMGIDMVGIGAYEATEKYQRAKERYEQTLKRIGESQKFIGGHVNNLLYTYALVLGIGFFALSLLFLALESWFLASLFLLLAVYGFVRQLSLSGEFYMNRNHIVCKHPWPWKTNMMWWRDVESVDVSMRYLVFRGRGKCMVAPGWLFWKANALKKLDYIFYHQIKEREIYIRPLDVFSIPRNKNVRVNHFNRKAKK